LSVRLSSGPQVWFLAAFDLHNKSVLDVVKQRALRPPILTGHNAQDIAITMAQPRAPGHTTRTGAGSFLSSLLVVFFI
jgi:hypothetical protein